MVYREPLVLLRILVLISLLFSAPLYATKVYRSVDENGRTVYSTTPPDEKKHETVDIEIQNNLGSTITPSSDTPYYRFTPSSPATTSRTYYPRKKDDKLDMRALQEKCERYRNSGGGTDYHKKKRDYWCSRLHRGK